MKLTKADYTELRAIDVRTASGVLICAVFIDGGVKMLDLVELDYRELERILDISRNFHFYYNNLP